MELPRSAPDEYHFVIQSRDRETGSNDFRALCGWAKREDYYLCTLAAADERLKEDQAFKLYYVFSAPPGKQDNENKLAILEFVLNDPQRPLEYPSIRDLFPAVRPLEEEIYDLFGIYPHEENLRPRGGHLLHHHLPVDFFPLRRSRSLDSLLGKIRDSEGSREEPPPPDLAEGMTIIPVGPIHAGVIEPGHFPFQAAGEIIEELPLQLGYKHRGLEKLFETDFELESGWKLAERVSGDSSFAHSWAYCQAVENLAGITLPDLVLYWRTLFLELERICNHVGDAAALVHDMAYDRLASPLFVLKEAVMQLNNRLTGSRLLRGVNLPGGLKLESKPGFKDHIAGTQSKIQAVKKLFNYYCRRVMNMPSCRERMITTGVLTEKEARNATGLVRRASGWKDHDFRLRRPQGIYAEPEVKKLIEESITPEAIETDREFPIYEYHLQGDVFARMAMRVAEVETSARIIDHVISKLEKEKYAIPPPLESLKQALKQTPNLEFGIGYVEGWRGDVFYWLMKGPNNTIFRCQPRDPSIFNWYAFPFAVVRKEKIEKKAGTQDKADKAGKAGESKEYWENILADFPLINKSFNLSYAGHDK